MPTSISNAGTLRPGDEIPPRTHRIERAAMIAFSGWFGSARNLHTDDDAADELGLPRPIMQGLHLAGLIEDHLLTTFGDAWMTGGRIFSKFVGVVFQNDIVTISATVEANENNRLVLSIICTEQHGRVVLRGSAEIPIPPTTGESP